jgi:hypothetical protein
VPEKVVVSDQWGQIIYYDEWDSLELRWLPSTANADDRDLRTTMEVFANEALNQRPKTLIVDTTEFGHTWNDGMMQWRDTHIIPRYNESGAVKFAFIANPNYPGPTVETGATPAPDGPANFPTGWFKTREGAYRWLAE